MNRPFTHCPNCGNQLPGDVFPQTCGACERMHFLNPTPVAALVIPVEGGLLTVRRGIPPQVGHLALPGGYVDLNETWQHAAIREVEEETGLVLDVDDVELFDVLSAPDGTLLLFGKVPPISMDMLASLAPTQEASDFVVVHEHQNLAFPLHTQILDKFLSEG